MNAVVAPAAPASAPATIWRLTAPESHVLLHGPAADGRVAFALAILEMVARGTLHYHPASPDREAMIGPGSNPEPPAEQPLISAWLLYGGAPLDTLADGAPSLRLKRLFRRAASRYRSLDRYRFQEVTAALVDRYLFARERFRYLWIVPAQRVVVTPAGERLAAELRARLQEARQHLETWSQHEPDRANDCLRRLGAAVLLAPAMWPIAARCNGHGHAVPAATSLDRPLDLAAASAVAAELERLGHPLASTDCETRS